MLPQIHDKYVSSGKVEIVFLDLPLRMHPHAFNAAEAAGCAGEQSRFWEMYRRLFSNQRMLAPPQLRAHAEAIGLDLAAFDKCVAGGRQEAKIHEDVRVTQMLGIAGTPAFLLGTRIAGTDKVEVVEIVRGLPPVSELEKRLDALLAEQAAPEGSKRP